MRGKVVLLVGLGIGYVLGARAGRERYEQIKRGAHRIWNDPRVSQQVHNVEQFAKDKAPEVVEFIGDTAKKVTQRSTNKGSTKSSSAKPKAATSSGSKKSTAKTAGSSSASTAKK